MEQSGVVGLSITGDTERVTDLRDAPFCTKYVLAQLLGFEQISEDVVRGWTESYTIPTVKIGRHRVINLHRIFRRIIWSQRFGCLHWPNIDFSTMANSLWGLIRFFLPQQSVVPYMESKIPVPTDNIYKFYALFSLFLLIFSIGAILYVNQNNNDRVLRLYPELESLKQSKQLTAHEAARKALLERLLEVQKTDQRIYKLALGALGGVAFWGMIYGFWRWHREIQPRIDEANRVQLDISKLNLIKLQLEVDKLQGKGVDTP